MAQQATDIRAEFKSAVSAAQDSLQATSDRLQGEIAEVAKGMSTEKMGRDDLASMLAEMAGRIHGTADGGKNGKS